MSTVAVARRYAEALADVAVARDQVDQIDAEVGAFANMVSESRELRDVFASPIISQEDKRRVLDALIEQLRPSPVIANLLRTMLSHYRLQDLVAVHEQFRRGINKRKGIALAEVTSAVALSQSEQNMLSGKLETLAGKKVEVEFRTDPSLIGGVVTRIESVVYDGSIRTQLQSVKERLKGSSV